MYLGGNYLSNYTGTDSNGDGLGDALYNNTGDSNQDMHPLILPQGWFVTESFSAPGDVTDYVVFGEKPDAIDGHDSYDVSKPPIPSAPYVYTWFDANLSEPYNKLGEDYRFFT